MNDPQVIVAVVMAMTILALLWIVSSKHKCKFEHVHQGPWIQTEQDTLMSIELFACKCGLTHERYHIVDREGMRVIG